MLRTYLPPPLCLGLGVNKEDYYPLKKGRGGKTAYRGAGSTIDRLTHNSTICKENVESPQKQQSAFPALCCFYFLFLFYQVAATA